MIINETCAIIWRRR